jgi:streptomycin 6-kinase
LKAVPDSPLKAHSASPAELRERIDAERRGRPFLVFRDGDGAQRILALDA